MEQNGTAAGPPPQRRGWARKSRNGCLRCKQRRVKCDEEVPCTACVRHKVRCSLEKDGASPLDRGASDTPRGQTGTPTASSRGTPAASRLPPDLSWLPPPEETHDCFITTSELLLHWTTRAYESLGPAGDPHAMQFTFPQLGLTHPYLLRGILAFSAFHLSHLHPAERHRYCLLATHHQALAVRGMRQALSAQITPENSAPVYLTSMFLAVTKFAGFPDCEDHAAHGCSAPLTSLVEVFSVCSGMEAILRSFGEDIDKGPLRFMFGRDGGEGPPPSILPLLSSQLPALRSSLETLAAGSASGEVVLAAVDAMASCVAGLLSKRHSHAAPEMLALFSWPMLLPREFLGLVRRRDHLALAVLAHYCVLVYWADGRLWCFDGWVRPLVEELVGELEGGPAGGFLEWPLGVIGAGVK